MSVIFEIRPVLSILCAGCLALVACGGSEASGDTTDSGGSDSGGSDSGGSDGVGFAIPSNTIKSIASQLISSGKAQHAYLGVELGSNGASAKVVTVRTGTPASKAGLQIGDVITSLGGTKVSSSDDLRSAINARKPGDKVAVTYTRNGKSHTVSLTLASRPSS